MSQFSKGQEYGPGRSSHGSRDSVLVVLDERQWSYLQRRYELTPRELQIADLVCRGLGNGRIAESLKIRPGTVKTHVRNIYRKVKVKNKITMLLRFMAEANELAGPAHFSPPQYVDRAGFEAT
jgi:DNA-binding NarL/FixJ family response regulator